VQLQWLNKSEFLSPVFLSFFSFITPIHEPTNGEKQQSELEPAAKKIKSTPEHYKKHKTCKYFDHKFHAISHPEYYITWRTNHDPCLKSVPPPHEYNLCKIPVGLVQQVEMFSFPHKNTNLFIWSVSKRSLGIWNKVPCAVTPVLYACFF